MPEFIKAKRQLQFIALSLCLVLVNLGAAAELSTKELSTKELSSKAQQPTEPSPRVSMGEYTTCAVYYRMMAGSLRRKSGLANLAALETEKMDILIAIAKEIAIQEDGGELGAENFLEEWQAEVSHMTDQINRNYDNISNLKYRYKKRCQALLDTVELN